VSISRVGPILIAISLGSYSSLCAAQSDQISKETFRQLAMEHADCAIFYLASSMCAGSDAIAAARMKKGFETMMARAYRFATEAGMLERTVTTYGRDLLEEINKGIGGDCKGMPILQDRYKMCQALAEDFNPRGQQIMQKLLEDQAHDPKVPKTIP
jgi:hypothetical protein